MDPLISAVYAVQGGDRKAFREIIVSIKKPQLNYIANLVKNIMEAEDIFSQLTERIFLHIHSCPTDNRRHCNNWIYKISTNLCRTYFRKQKRKPVIESFEESQIGVNGKGDYREEMETIDKALEELPIERQKAFVLVIINGVRVADVAEILDVPKGTVKIWVRRVKLHLRDRLNREEDLS